MRICHWGICQWNVQVMLKTILELRYWRVAWEPTSPAELVESYSDVDNDIRSVMAAIFDFARWKIMLESMIPLCFLSLKTWLCTPKWSFVEKKVTACVAYSNMQLAAMVMAILDWKFTPPGFGGLCTSVLRGGIQVNFLKISAFYIFFFKVGYFFS